jgi:hypothetical protein
VLVVLIHSSQGCPVLSGDLILVGDSFVSGGRVIVDIDISSGFGHLVCSFDPLGFCSSQC